MRRGGGGTTSSHLENRGVPPHLEKKKRWEVFVCFELEIIIRNPTSISVLCKIEQILSMTSFINCSLRN